MNPEDVISILEKHEKVLKKLEEGELDFDVSVLDSIIAEIKKVKNANMSEWSLKDIQAVQQKLDVIVQKATHLKNKIVSELDTLSIRGKAITSYQTL